MKGVIVWLRSTARDVKFRSNISADVALQHTEEPIENDQEELESGIGLEYKGILPQCKSF